LLKATRVYDRIVVSISLSFSLSLRHDEIVKAQTARIRKTNCFIVQK
jgi:hypothetical protein